MRKIIVNEKIVEFSTNFHNIKIINSTKIKSKKEMKEVLEKILDLDPYEDKRDRTISQYILEWRSHNIMYHIPLKFFKEHCKDCDLSNNESKFRLFVYNILGRL